VSDNERYHAIYAQAPQLVDEQLINGMHVHVAVPDRALGVLVVNRLQRWLPVLLAMSTNSPLWDGRDTGFASWRTLHFDRWPVAGPPPQFEDVADYDRRVEALLQAGIVRDRAQLYWHARISERYPTIEVRACDVQLRIDDALMIAGTTRALVAAALEAEVAAEPMPLLPPELVRAASWHAARHGLSGQLLDLATCTPRSAEALVREMVEYVTPQLEQADDLRQVTALVDRLLQDGTGAERQRKVLEYGGVVGLLAMLSAETVANWHPEAR
jgi:carboxylate-amine ligase